METTAHIEIISLNHPEEATAYIRRTPEYKEEFFYSKHMGKSPYKQQEAFFGSPSINFKRAFLLIETESISRKPPLRR